MEQERKLSSGVIVLIVFLCLLVLGLGGYIVYDKFISKEETPETDNTEEVQEDKLTIDELLNKLTGEWGTCENGTCYGIFMGKRENGEYYYTPYLMWSEGGASGTIKNSLYKEKDVYSLTVYYAAYEDIESSGPEHTDEYEINISEISSNIIYVDKVKYQKILTDRETFFNAIK